MTCAPNWRYSHGNSTIRGMIDDFYFAVKSENPDMNHFTLIAAKTANVTIHQACIAAVLDKLWKFDARCFHLLQIAQ